MDIPIIWLQRVKSHDSEALQRQLYRKMAKRGLVSFVQDIVAPLITRIGEAWSRNEIGIFEEHLFPQHLEKLFRTTLANMSPRKACATCAKCCLKILNCGRGAMV